MPLLKKDTTENRASLKSANKNFTKQKRNFLSEKYSHFWIVLYIPLFLFGFFILEARTDITEHLIYSPLDNYIPFCEYFIVPYLLWFPYLLGTVFFSFYQGMKGERKKREFYQFAYMLISGLTISLIAYIIWPNTLQLRPEVYPGDNVFISICAALQGFDTPSNVCPSIHVFSTVTVHIYILKSKYFKNKRALRISSFIVMVFICLSTLFIKQHSVIDIFCALLMNLLLYLVTYHLIFKKEAPVC